MRSTRGAMKALVTTIAVHASALAHSRARPRLAQRSAATPTPNRGQREQHVLQSGSPGNQYAAPSAGVITRWSFQPRRQRRTRLKLKVGRAAGGANVTIVGESALENIAASTGRTRSPPAIPVQAGRLHRPLQPHAPEPCAVSRPGHNSVAVPGDPAPGISPAVRREHRRPIQHLRRPRARRRQRRLRRRDPGPLPGRRLQAGRLRPARDHDHQGPQGQDEEEDATFEFSGTDARAVAGFECSLDGGAFAACTSPHTVKVKKGKHTFSVRATDQAGNVDGSPATFDWKVKKKKKKK